MRYTYSRQLTFDPFIDGYWIGSGSCYKLLLLIIIITDVRIAFNRWLLQKTQFSLYLNYVRSKRELKSAKRVHVWVNLSIRLIWAEPRVRVRERDRQNINLWKYGHKYATQECHFFGLLSWFTLPICTYFNFDVTHHYKGVGSVSSSL